MIRVRLFASIFALASLTVYAVAWPEAYASGWQWAILGITLVMWMAAVWTALPIFAGIALLIGFVLAAVLMSLGANELLALMGSCLTLSAWMHSRIIQIAPAGAQIKHEMLLVRNLAGYMLLIGGVSLMLGMLALNIQLPMTFFLAFVGAAALILLTSRLIIWLRQLAA